MGAVTTSIPSFLMAIRQNESLEEMIRIVKQIDALKVALESVDAFRAQSILYARLEAEALLKVIELGGGKSLRSPHKETAAWLSSLANEERERFISMCADGLTIDQVYKREVGDDRKIGKALRELKDSRAELVQELKETGIVDMSDYVDTARRKLAFDPPTAADIVDGTRTTLRQAGGVCTGTGSHLYVMKNSPNKEALQNAVLLRYESIRRDLESIQSIAKASGLKMSYKEFSSGANWDYENEPYVVHILLALDRMGLLSDSEEAYSAIMRADVRKECDYAYNSLRLSREKYIEAEYRAIQMQRTHAVSGSME